MLILYGILIFWFGLIIGFLLLRARLYIDRKNYSGTIYITHDELQEKTLYSLELADYPETLEFKKEVVFKVDASDSSDRD
jgi:hypothetical protein